MLHRYPNTLNRDFHAKRSNQKRVTDISCVKTNQGFLYLSVIRDLYDLSIVSCRTSPKQTVNPVLDTIREARTKEKVTDGPALHSDQGFQYLSQVYFNLTQSYHSFAEAARVIDEYIHFYSHVRLQAKTKLTPESSGISFCA